MYIHVFTYIHVCIYECNYEGYIYIYIYITFIITYYFFHIDIQMYLFVCLCEKSKAERLETRQIMKEKDQLINTTIDCNTGKAFK